MLIFSMMRQLWLAKLGMVCGLFGAVLVGCAELEALEKELLGSPAANPTSTQEPQAETELPMTASNTAEDLDATTAAQRASATRTAGGGRLLGTTIASLGTPSEPGFWLKTPLVAQETKGNVRSKDTGERVSVTLIPIDGPATAGSRVSLSAMRLLGVSLTDLAELEVRSD